MTDNSTTGAVSAARTFPAQTDVATVQWQFAQPTIGLQRMFIQRGSTIAVEIYAGSSNQAKIYYTSRDGQQIELAPYEPNIWQTITVHVNVVLDTCDIVVNGVLRAKEAQLRNPVASIDKLHFQTGTSAASYVQYVDNVVVRH